MFHDLGNLNFTFLVRDADYDLDRQLQVIQTACQSLGISTEKSGRNDLLANGQKFSGNAFYHAQGHAYHHGTLLVDADMEKLSRYLTPSKAKLASKGVSSVRSRVTNLKTLCPSLTIEILKSQLWLAFQSVYGLPSTPLTLSQEDLAAIEADAIQLGSWQRRYGPRLPFSFSCEDRFSWGNIQLQLQVEAGHIAKATVYSDTMDWTLADTVSQALTGCRFTLENMTIALEKTLHDRDICQDLCQLLSNQQI